ncbi:MAG: hypothetical protein Q9162_001926 [Coniocarpon cinnabarinum]
MATAQVSKKEWIVILPDNMGMLQKRMEVRPKHLEVMKPEIKSPEGRWSFGGATLEEQPKEGEAPKINGSILLGYGETKEEMLEAVKRDIYCTSGVWDQSRIQILPFRTAARRLMSVGVD